jgi:hypothetical protein
VRTRGRTVFIGRWRGSQRADRTDRLLIYHEPPPSRWSASTWTTSITIGRIKPAAGAAEARPERRHRDEPSRTTLATPRRRDQRSHRSVEAGSSPLLTIGLLPQRSGFRRHLSMRSRTAKRLRHPCGRVIAARRRVSTTCGYTGRAQRKPRPTWACNRLPPAARISDETLDLTVNRVTLCTQRRVNTPRRGASVRARGTAMWRVRRTDLVAIRTGFMPSPGYVGDSVFLRAGPERPSRLSTARVRMSV